MSEFSVTCECGTPIAVSAAKAGATVACDCGRECPVPTLSQLRRNAGQEAYITNAVEIVNKALNTGELPGENCVHCQVTGGSIIRCRVTCETRMKKHRSSGSEANFLHLFGAIVSPIWIWNIKDTGHTELHGRDTVVEPEFRLCDLCEKSTGNPRRKRNLKTLLRMTPQYAQLLDECPQAKVAFLDKTES